MGLHRAISQSSRREFYRQANGLLLLFNTLALCCYSYLAGPRLDNVIPLLVCALWRGMSERKKYGSEGPEVPAIQFFEGEPSCAVTKNETL